MKITPFTIVFSLDIRFERRNFWLCAVCSEQPATDHTVHVCIRCTSMSSVQLTN